MSLNLHKLQDKRVFYILAGTLVILLVLFVTLLSRQKKLQEEADRSLPPDTTQQQTSYPLPSTKFADYTLNTELPSLPTSVKLSDLKSSFTTGEALDLATKVGFQNSLVNDGVGIILVTDQGEGENQQGLLSINKTTGNFVVVSEKGYPTGGSDPTSAAQSFLQKLGLWDNTLVVTATYKRESYPGYTFVEIHRSWENLGLPLINPLGVLNLTEGEKLANVRLGYIESAAPDDPDVIESSDGYAGKVRPNQFNTITVGVTDENNYVMNLTSNLKLLDKTEQKPTDQTLKTPEEALEDLKNGKTTFSLAKPTGEGTIEIQNVFPDNQVDLQNAVINEVILTYVDEFGQKTQSTSLHPYYLFRGTATTASGYDVQFVQTIAALRNVNTLGIFAQNSQPTVFPGQGSTLQYGTFNWLSPAPNPIQGVACAGLTQIFQLPDGGYIGWYPNQPERNWYYVPPAGFVPDAAQWLEIKKVIRWEVAKACKGSINDPAICAYSDSSVDSTLQTACMYIGSGSPFIHIYSKSPTEMKVRLPESVTYADPVFSSEKTWSFIASREKTLTLADGLAKEKLYYEYNKEALNSVKSSLINSNEGFLVNKNKLSEFADLVAAKAGLNLEERADLLVEIKREARKQTGEKLKIGLLDRNTVDELLPVTITPQPQSYSRMLFYLTSANTKEKLREPSIQKVERGGDLVVVELGAVGL